MTRQQVSIRYIAVLGFQRVEEAGSHAPAPCSFNPLYRGTWFPTTRPSICCLVIDLVSIRYIAVLGFQHPGDNPLAVFLLRFNPLYRGTWFPTLRRVWQQAFRCNRFQSAISRYLVSNLRPPPHQSRPQRPVSIRYIAVLGFQQTPDWRYSQETRKGFNPLYRGTWFPTDGQVYWVKRGCRTVSIRYIAVLGFQQ